MSTESSAKPFIVGDLSRSIRESQRCAQHIDKTELLETTQKGDVFTRWGWLGEWDDGCVRPGQLETLRRIGDPLCDDLVRFLDIKTGEDGLARILSYIEATPVDDRNPIVTAFWDSVNCLPPPGVSALHAADTFTPLTESWDIPLVEAMAAYDRQEHALSFDAKGKGSAAASLDEDLEFTCDAAILRRNRRPPPVLSEGQAVFWRYSTDMFDALGHFSLAGGFASSRIMPVLHETGYLTSSSKDAVYRRLNETGQALVDFMTDVTPVVGLGWRSAVRVRLLHSQVRIRIMANKTKLRKYDESKDGIPINQEDMCATLCGFGLAPLWCQRRLGVHLSPEEELAFIACWRHIGYYLGVHPWLLKTFLSAPRVSSTQKLTTSRSHRFFASIAFHLFGDSVPPEDPFKTSSYKILNSIAYRPPTGKSPGYHCELSRMLLGPGLADQLGIPPGSSKDRWAVYRHSWESWAQANFGRFYRAGWELDKALLFKRVMTLVVTWQLGEKRSTYSWRDERHHASKISEMVAEYAGAGEDSNLEFGSHIATQVRWKAKMVFLEMAGVCLLTAALSLGVVVKTVSVLRASLA